MARIIYDDGIIKATVECSKKNVKENVLGPAVNSLLGHLSSHVGTYETPEVFETIGDMKSDFLGKVLRYMIEVGQAGGCEIPESIRSWVLRGGDKCEWEDPDAEESEDQ